MQDGGGSISVGEVILCCQFARPTWCDRLLLQQTLLTAWLPWLLSLSKLHCSMLLLSSVLEHSSSFFKARILDNRHQCVGEADGNQLPDVEKQPDTYCSYSRSESRTAVTILCVCVQSTERDHRCVYSVYVQVCIVVCVCSWLIICMHLYIRVSCYVCVSWCVCMCMNVWYQSVCACENVCVGVPTCTVYNSTCLLVFCGGMMWCLHTIQCVHIVACKHVIQVSEHVPISLFPLQEPGPGTISGTKEPYLCIYSVLYIQYYMM